MMKRIYFILLVVIAYACVEIPSDLSIPEWDVELNIPITDRFYNMDSLLKDSEYGRTEQYGNYLVYSFYSDTIQYKSGISNLLEDKLDFEYLDHTFPLAEGEIEISIPLPDSIYIENAEFVSGECIFEIHNMSSKSVDYMIKFTDFTQYGKKISIENEISAYQFESLSIDLIDTKYISENGTSIKMLIEASGNFDSISDSAKISLKMKNTILKK